MDVPAQHLAPAPGVSASVAPAPPLPAAEARITASLMDTGAAGYWSARVLPIEPPLVDLVRPCYERALAKEPRLVGWMIVDVTFGYTGTSTTRLAQSSGLPDGLTSCVVERLRAVHPRESGWSGPASAVYISLG